MSLTKNLSQSVSRMGVLREPHIPPILDIPCLNGQSVLITGGSKGLGFDAARQLMRLDVSTIILAQRNLSDGNAAKKALEDEFGGKHLSDQATTPSTIHVLSLDLKRPDSLLGFLEELNIVTSGNGINLALLNADINRIDWEQTPAGNEEVLQINYLSNAFLSILLLPLLNKAAKTFKLASRLVLVSSGSQSMNDLATILPSPEADIFAQFNNRKLYSPRHRYGDSKLLLSMWTNELAKHVNSSAILINSVCPGMCATDFDAGLLWYVRIVMHVIRKIHARTVEEGGRTYVHALTLAGPESHGQFLQHLKISR